MLKFGSGVFGTHTHTLVVPTRLFMPIKDGYRCFYLHLHKKKIIEKHTNMTKMKQIHTRYARGAFTAFA